MVLINHLDNFDHYYDVIMIIHHDHHGLDQSSGYYCDHY